MSAAEKVEIAQEEQDLAKKLVPDKTELVVLFLDYKEGKNSKGTGIRGTFEFEVLQRGGEFHGKKLWLDINPEHPNDMAVEISTKLLNSFLIATGECPNGLADIANDRTKLIEFKGYKVVADVRQKMSKEYVNKDGIKVPAKMRNEIRGFKQI